jgi:capsule polysaccharide export protein KpsE/RkpR
MRHYDVDPTGNYPMTNLRNEYEDNIKFSRTEYMSVLIDVLDTDPDTAALIANDIAALLDTIKNGIVQSRAKEALKIVQGDLYAKETRIKLLDDSLNILREKGVYDYEKQVERLIEAYGKAIVGGNAGAAKTLQSQLDTLGKYGRAFVTLRDQLIYDVENLSMIKKKYDDAKVDADSFIKSYFLVDKAYPAEKKSYPVRWLIVLVSIVSSLLVGMVVLIGMENYRVYKAGQETA